MKETPFHETITIIGGDFRHFLLYRHFAKLGYPVTGLGLSTSTKEHSQKIQGKYTLSIQDLKPSDIWIGGIPFSRDDKYVYGDSLGTSILLEDFFSFLNAHPPKRLIAGQFSPKALDYARTFQIPCTDILKFDTLAIANAVPTAEGAIYHAIKESPYMLHGANCLVLGFGKCGKALAEKLKGLDAKVSVCVRKRTDLILAESLGFTPVPLAQLPKTLSSYLFVFNTIPAMVLDQQALNLVSNAATIIDIASMPGGVDFEAAKTMGKSAFHCLSLPGQLSPNTAADILFNEIQQLLQIS